MFTIEENKEKATEQPNSVADVSCDLNANSSAPLPTEDGSKNTTHSDNLTQNPSEEATADATDTQNDTAEVLDEYQQLNNYKDVLFNDLVGDYDEFGTYTVSDDIMQDLIDMPKKIDFIDEAGIHARGFLGDHIFSFLVTTPIKKDDGDAYCYLKLDEQIDRLAGFQYETQTVTIATYCYRYDELYDGFMRDAFHLREYESDDTGEEGRKYRADYLTSRYDLFYTMRACSEDYYEKLEEIYFNHRLLMLGMDPELTLIMAEFNKKRQKLDPYLIISRRRFFFLNQLLDEVLQMQAERLSKSEISARMEQLDAKYIAKSKEIKQKTLTNTKVVEMMPKTSNVSSATQSINKKPANKQQKGVSKGGGDKPKSNGGKKKGGKGKDKSKGKDKGKEKPKATPRAGPKVVPKIEQPDLVISSFVDTIKEMGNVDLFGRMEM